MFFDDDKLKMVKQMPIIFFVCFGRVGMNFTDLNRRGGDNTTLTPANRGERYHLCGRGGPPDPGHG